MAEVVLTDAKITEIKSRTMGKFFLENRDDELKIYRADMSKYEYCEIAEIDCKTVERLGSFYGLLEYFENGGQFILNCETYVNDELSTELSCKYSDSYDFLELFEEKSADNSTELTVKELFSKSADEIIEYLKDSNFTVWDSIKSCIFDDMDKDDVPGNVEQDIVNSYIEEEPMDAMEKAIDYADSYDLRDIAKEIIDRL